MKKEYTEIFWGLYAIKKYAEKLQEQFMPEKDRALLKYFIYGCSYFNLEIVFGQIAFGWILHGQDIMMYFLMM